MASLQGSAVQTCTPLMDTPSSAGVYDGVRHHRLCRQDIHGNDDTLDVQMPDELARLSDGGDVSSLECWNDRYLTLLDLYLQVCP